MKIALRKVPDDNGLCQRDFQRKKWFLCILYLLWTSCQCTCQCLLISMYTSVCHYGTSRSFVTYTFCVLIIFFHLFWVFHLMALRPFTLAREKTVRKYFNICWQQLQILRITSKKYFCPFGGLQALTRYAAKRQICKFYIKWVLLIGRP